jgi:neutral ceramidase
VTFAVIRTLLLTAAIASAQSDFQAGAARRDITPREPVPMWGYGDRHDKLSTGTLDPLYADALVMKVGAQKIAVVGLDLGRSPNEKSLQAIRARVRKESGIEHSFIAGSHTHHGPVLELSDEAGKGKGRFDAAIRYYSELEDAIVAAVKEADQRLVPAKLTAGSVQLQGFNRNRHSKITPELSDRELAALRVDDGAGKPIALLFNFTAHPTTIPSSVLQFSADWVGAAKNVVAAELGGAALFMQGSAGDQSVNRGAYADYKEYGAALGREVVKLASGLKTEVPANLGLTVREDRFQFGSRTNFKDPFVKMAFSAAFFPELIPNYLDEYADGIRPRLTVAMLSPDIAFVGVSGEFFTDHSLRLKQRARVKHLFFFGYCNGYHQYFPTIEGASEGGYGADRQVAPAEVGAGEQMMNRALVWLYEMRGKLK